MSDILSQIEEIQGNIREFKSTWGNTVTMLDNIKTSLKADRQKAIDDAYDRGLNDAWDAARKIVCDEGVDMNTLCTIFRRGCIESIIRDYSASEVIEKLKADDEIKVSDEVIWTEDESVVIVVTRVYTEKDVEWCDGVCRNGTVYQILTKHARKTGRHFDIESILKEMQS